MPQGILVYMALWLEDINVCIMGRSETGRIRGRAVARHWWMWMLECSSELTRDSKLWTA